MWKSLLEQRKSWGGYIGFILLLHILGLIGLYSVAKTSPAFWGIGLLAYTLGMRHAFDVDHIAAIDNTVRKLVQQKRNPLGVGFYFSLGHSSVVFLMSIVTAFSVTWAERELPWMQRFGGVIGASVSGLFLVIIGVINLIILISLYKLFVKFRGGKQDDNEFEELLESRGFIARMIKPLFSFISKSWHVYPLGFLFGLGFDTASEIALLAISAHAAKDAIPFIGVISLPLLFAAGMSLFDTADGMFMTKAYKWAFHTPVRKLYYNLTVTALAVIAALIIGVIELGQVLSEEFGMEGTFWTWLQDIDFGTLGFILVALFVIAWIVSIAVWKGMKIEERWRAKV
ncbi:HoxN/HupN/NixA family nickel/cobalt transporter [Paenibacillus chondroitinus]|uniref:Nickel/cobalt efflux system n=1 Tax=Paenibacillus chondroitinus TaxID=59842 RepID=A0ABU6DLN2_9BACL|nr:MULTISPECIES: HoxN/HupN/NixA family nickel/cobalt transporter [Paenibacillus]MCY9657922.1 HoxN/HupN/NixA family nickel/cobalt transporter [Paenibacillus anseongense]MEB4798694.1 HoxN/HupN/NixA family nickel/cobalt transporter [Paenibacillus chondroitinus]